MEQQPPQSPAAGNQDPSLRDPAQRIRELSTLVYHTIDVQKVPPVVIDDKQVRTVSERMTSMQESVAEDGTVDYRFSAISDNPDTPGLQAWSWKHNASEVRYLRYQKNNQNETVVVEDKPVTDPAGLTMLKENMSAFANTLEVRQGSRTRVGRHIAALMNVTLRSRRYTQTGQTPGPAGKHNQEPARKPWPLIG